MIGNWMSALIETYDICIKDSRTRGERIPLIPICHTLCNAHITVTIDAEGSFLTADVVPKYQQNTLIPCTESSAGRTASPRPHPMGDKLIYLVPDLDRYLENGISPVFRDSYKLYIDQLKRWCDSPYHNRKVEAVLRYVKKGSLMHDLQQTGVIVLDHDGHLASKNAVPDAPLFSVAKIAGDQDSAFIRWSVDIPGDPCRDTWEDESLIEDWIGYVQSSEGDSGLCYLTGDEIPLARNHPSRIRNGGDGAKIISSNDKNGFTFRGRFEDSDEACGVGFVPTQKAHNALRWLIGRQGYCLGNLCVLVWNLKGDDISNPADDFSSMLGFGEDEPRAMTNEQAAEHLRLRLRGYNSKILTSDVMVLVLDSAASGKGRISIVTYRHELGEDLVEGLEHWHGSCAWIHDYVKVKGEDGRDRRTVFVGAPSPRDISRAAYGNGADDAVVSYAVKRILPCIMDGSRIPEDIVHSVIRRATMPLSMEAWEWRKTLSIACSVFKQFTGGDYQMTLEKERKSRDYLYGRLLAVADLMEGEALKRAEENRQTTAIRLMQRFSEFPYTTWKDIELALVPYTSRLGPELTGYYQGRIAEIMELFEGDDFRDNSNLSGEFLLAYHCQRNDQFKKKDKKENAEVDE